MKQRLAPLALPPVVSLPPSLPKTPISLPPISSTTRYKLPPTPRYTNANDTSLFNSLASNDDQFMYGNIFLKATSTDRHFFSNTIMLITIHGSATRTLHTVHWT